MPQGSSAQTIDAEHVAREINSALDPLSLHQLNPERYPYVLQSTRKDGPLGCFDIVFAFPQESIVHNDVSSKSFLEKLGHRLNAVEKTGYTNERDIPFRGGWFLFFAYELAGEIEHLPAVKSELAVPIAMATRIPVAVVIEHKNRKAWIIAEKSFPDSEKLVSLIAEDVEKVLPVRIETVTPDEIIEEPSQRYLEIVSTAKEYIRDGDIFQANLSREWVARFNGKANAQNIFARLRETNPAPFAGLVRINNETSIVSSSPERLIKVENGKIRTRPIAGTYPRGQDRASDERYSAELLSHPKERSEHIMLIDLERNDLGRVCRAGSISVPELMVLESYQHVHHIVSEVVGDLNDGVTTAQIIAATFPGGTITGCPKVRCMEIIAELENGVRGAYTGSIGYVNHDGSMDLNILIRTITVHGDEARFRAGAGIVADSDPRRELEETRAKAEGLIRALQ